MRRRGPSRARDRRAKDPPRKERSPPLPTPIRNRPGDRTGDRRDRSGTPAGRQPAGRLDSQKRLRPPPGRTERGAQDRSTRATLRRAGRELVEPRDPRWGPPAGRLDAGRADASRCRLVPGIGPREKGIGSPLARGRSRTLQPIGDSRRSVSRMWGAATGDVTTRRVRDAGSEPSTPPRLQLTRAGRQLQRSPPVTTHQGCWRIAARMRSANSTAAAPASPGTTGSPRSRTTSTNEASSSRSGFAFSAA
jgi:hypothetical protein